jgi:hypothetical protein
VGIIDTKKIAGQTAHVLRPIIHDGRVMKLDHLRPFTFECPRPNIKWPLSIVASFSNHCYTEGYDSDVHDPDQIILTEGKDRHRVFCPDRYELSHQLPTLIADLPNKRVHGTAEAETTYMWPTLTAGGALTKSISCCSGWLPTAMAGRERPT